MPRKEESFARYDLWHKRNIGEAEERSGQLRSNKQMQRTLDHRRLPVIYVANQGSSDREIFAISHFHDLRWVAPPPRTRKG